MADEELNVEQQELDAENIEEELDEEELANQELKEKTELQVEEIGTLRQRLTISVPEDLIDNRRDEALSETRRDQTIPGFRKGRAPMELVRKRFGKEVDNELCSRLVFNAYLAVVEREGMKVIGDPAVIVSVKNEKDGTESEKALSPQDALDHIDFPESGPLVYKCEVDISPEFELPSLEGVDVKKPVFKISDEEVDQEIDRLRKIQGQYIVKDEKGVVEEDDILICHFVVKVGDRELISEENAALPSRDTVYTHFKLDGLGDGAKGKKVDDVITLKSNVPDDHEEMELRGQEATVEIRLREIKSLQMPELNDEFTQSLGLDNVDELKTMVRNECEAMQSQYIKMGMRAQIDQYLIDKTAIELPEGLSSKQTERAVYSKMLEKLQQGVPAEDLDKEMDELRSTAAEEIKHELKLDFIFEKIADEKGEEWDIEVEEEELNGVINEIARRRNARFDRVRDELSASGKLMNLYISMRNDKIRDVIIGQAKIEETTDDKEASEK